MERKVINLRNLYQQTAKLNQLQKYIQVALSQIEGGEEIVLTGEAPIWLYLSLAHALHGKVRKLFYSSPVTGEVLIFDHSPD
jgi:CRISPR-associated Csx3 family protein